MKPIEPIPDDKEILNRQLHADLAILTASAASQAVQAFEPLENLLDLLDQDQTLSKASRDYVIHARSSLARAYQCTGDLLLLSRAYDSRGIINLGAVVDATLSLLRSDIDTHNIRVERLLEKDVLVQTSRPEVRQLISSLILNVVGDAAEISPKIVIQIMRNPKDPQREYIFSILTNGEWPVNESLFTLEERPIFTSASAENLPATVGYIKLLLGIVGARAEFGIESDDSGWNRHLRVILPSNIPETSPSYPV